MNMLCPKCQVSYTIPEEHLEATYFCSACETSFPLPQICSQCHYFNRAGLQHCFQCKAPLQKVSNSTLPHKEASIVRSIPEQLFGEIRAQFILLAQVLFLLGVWTSVYSAQKLQPTLIFYGLFWGGVALMIWGCIRQWWLVAVLLFGGTLWLFMQHFEIFWRPEFWNYGFACGFLLIFLLSANLLYLWMTTTKI